VKEGKKDEWSIAREVSKYGRWRSGLTTLILGSIAKKEDEKERVRKGGSPEEESHREGEEGDYIITVKKSNEGHERGRQV